MSYSCNPHSNTLINNLLRFAFAAWLSLISLQAFSGPGACQGDFNINNLAFATGVGDAIHCLYFQTGTNQFSRLFSAKSEHGLAAYSPQNIRFHAFSGSDIESVIAPSSFLSSGAYKKKVMALTGSMDTLSMSNMPSIGEAVVGFRTVGKNSKGKRRDKGRYILASDFLGPNETVIDLEEAFFDGFSIDTQMQITNLFYHIQAGTSPTTLINRGQKALTFDLARNTIKVNPRWYTKGLKAEMLRGQSLDGVARLISEGGYQLSDIQEIFEQGGITTKPGRYNTSPFEAQRMIKGLLADMGKIHLQPEVGSIIRRLYPGSVNSIDRWGNDPHQKSFDKGLPFSPAGSF